MYPVNMVVRDLGDQDIPVYGIQVKRGDFRPVITCRTNEPDELSVITHDPETLEFLQQRNIALLVLGERDIRIRSVIASFERGKLVLDARPVETNRYPATY